MTTEPRDGSLASTPESRRYIRVLDGGSVTGARLNQSAAAGKETAGRLFNRFKDKRSESRQAAEDRKAIESGEVKDIQ